MSDNTKFGLQINMPYREWTKFKTASVETSKGESWPDATTKEEWTDNHYGHGILKKYWDNVVANRSALYPVVYPDAKDFKLVSGMDAPITGGLYFDLGEIEWDLAPTNDWIEPRFFIMREPRNGVPSPKPYWRPDSITGQHYDGINEWPNGWPILLGAWFYSTQKVDTKVEKVYRADLPNEYEIWGKSWYSDAYQDFYYWREEFFDHGLCVGRYYTDEGLQHGDLFELSVTSKRLKIYYYNPVVNSIEDEAGNPCYYIKESNGTILVFKGLGFNIPNSSLNVYSQTDKGWADIVRFITFKGLQGQGDYLLTKIGSSPPTSGRFYVSSNTELILHLPDDMPIGAYEILLEKSGLGTAPACESYAGDWRCYEDGRAYSGEKFTFLITDEEMPEKPRDPRTSIPIIKQRFKDFEGNVDTFRHYAPIDIRGSENFWDGRIKNVSGLNRGVNDQTGLFLSSDISIDYANTDKEFSKLLAEYRLANEPLEMFLAWRDYPESFKTAIFKAFVENIKRKGSLFTTDCRDLSSVYFKKQFPMHRINEDDYPDCDKNFLTKPKPEALGLLYHEADVLKSYESSGAMEAAYIDTVNHIYLAARGVLKEITEVYSDSEKKTVVTDYNVSYSAEGETLITFVQDQEASKITFNCKGYVYSGWNSSNGFIQHPIYVFLYILVFVFEIPFDLIDLDSFEAVKEILDNIDPNIGTKGFWGEMAEKSAENIMQEHLVTIGAAIFPDKYGRLTLSKKDISNISTTKIIFAQIDTFDPPLDDWGFKEAVNKIKLNWDYVPAAGIFKHSKSELKDDAIEAMSGFIIEEPLDLKWTTSTLLVMKRLKDEFYKRGKGYKKISFPVSMSFIEELDVHDSFRLQDPFGTHKEGLGVFGRYCFIEKIDYEFQDMKMNIEALDLSYIMRQYLVLGDETALADNWADASDEHKAFAYLGHEDTGKFLNGETAKILLDENVLAL